MTKLKSTWRLLVMLLVMTPLVLSAQSNIQDLHNRLEKTTNPTEKMRLYYDLANLNLARKPSIATYQANRSYSLAKSLDNSYYLRKSAVLLGKTFIKQPDIPKAKKWLKTGENLAKINKDLSLLLESATLLSGIEIRANNYKKAYEINLAAINYVNKNKNSFQKTITAPAVTNDNSTTELTDIKVQSLALTSEIEDLTTQNAVLNDELLRLQRELAEYQLKIEAGKKSNELDSKQDSQEYSATNIDSNQTSRWSDSTGRTASQIYAKTNREKLFSWVSAILGLLSLGLLAGLYFLSRKKEEQKENFDQTIIKKDRLLRNYKEEIQEHEALKSTNLLGTGVKVQAKKINPLSILVVDLGTNPAFDSDSKTSEFISFYSGLMTDIKALLSQYPNVFYVKKIGTTIIIGSGIDKYSHDPDQLLKAAKDIQAYIQETPALNNSAKIGIHSGPVFLSSIDYNTESLDILGHTFDQCAWIQSLAKAGQILISQETKSLLKTSHQLEFISARKDWTGSVIELFELN